MQTQDLTQQRIIELALAFAHPGSSPDLLVNNDFESAGIDSLGAVMLISDIETEFGLTFVQSDFGSITTLSELVRLVETKMGLAADA